ncbi:MAG: hypothetical protein RL693_1324 [Verrucomicrobiota bacterium]
MNAILLLHFAATAALVGLIWIVQLVSYPIMLRVTEKDFKEYHPFHCDRITFVVGPLILAETGTAIWLWSQGFAEPLFLWSLIPLVMTWISTALIQVPLHWKCERSYSRRSIQRLIQTNWIRTFCWSTRALLIAALVYQQLEQHP